MNVDTPTRSINARFNVVRGKSFVTRRNVSYELDEVGARIWELCDGTRSLTDIAQALTHEYDVPYEQALDDSRDFIMELREKGLLDQ